MEKLIILVAGTTCYGVMASSFEDAVRACGVRAGQMVTVVDNGRIIDIAEAMSACKSGPAEGYVGGTGVRSYFEKFEVAALPQPLRLAGLMLQLATETDPWQARSLAQTCAELEGLGGAAARERACELAYSNESVITDALAAPRVRGLVSPVSWVREYDDD